MSERERPEAHGDPREPGRASVSRVLSREQARAFYDRFGAKQDTQHFYEDPATRDLVAHADLKSAEHVFEFGCGTGRFAHDILSHHLPPGASYRGVDLSSTMVRLARERLTPFGERAKLEQSDGSSWIHAPDASLDRLISNYVLDLLSEEDMRLFVADAHRVLKPEGRLCLVSLTWGSTPLSRLVTWGWVRIHALRPSLVGGCRPIELLALLPDTSWRIEHRNVLTPFGVPSEIVIAAKL